VDGQHLTRRGGRVGGPTLGSLDEIEAAARVALSGQDAVLFLTTEDPLLRVAMQLIAQRSWEMRMDINEDLAIRVINHLAKAMK